MSARFVIEATHPALPGHFPGSPIVPGVVLLERGLALARAALGPLEVAALDQAKFVKPVGPGEPVEVLWRRDGAVLHLSFVAPDGAAIAQARFRLAA